MSLPPLNPGDAFRALANDVRLRLYYGVAAAGEATATQLARPIGLSASAVSYHLAQLGKFGLLEEVDRPDRDGRERWWRLADSRGLHVDDESDAGRALKFAVLNHHLRRIQAYLADLPPNMEPPGDEVSFSSDNVIAMTRDDADEFQAEVTNLLRKYAQRRGDTGRALTLIMVQGIPFRS